DGIGDACDPIDNDPDRDGIFTATDNCPITPNPIQSDVDRDGIGDACDPVDDDPDRDGIFTATDNCSGVWNPEQFDTDGNGLGDECDPWDDVWIGHWARPAVDDVYAAGISLGCGLSPLRFCPDANVTRAEMAAFLIRGMGHDDHSASEPAGFTDVDGISWYADYVDHLAEHGVTTGCSADPLRFCPNRSVTRAEVAAFLAKALGHDLTSIEYTGRFIDVADGDWYMPAVEHLAAIGIINGYPDGSFDPSAPISRAEMAALLQRSFLTP
ncbi:MAG: S-layer homology domain-containing protein, partial [Acidimicrobiia bacterium]|nr:S-layer homology domain-containing protein [Acidimicrobiia bacterium]